MGCGSIKLGNMLHYLRAWRIVEVGEARYSGGALTWCSLCCARVIGCSLLISVPVQGYSNLLLFSDSGSNSGNFLYSSQ